DPLSSKWYSHNARNCLEGEGYAGSHCANTYLQPYQVQETIRDKVVCNHTFWRTQSTFALIKCLFLCRGHLSPDKILRARRNPRAIPESDKLRRRPTVYCFPRQQT